jgi:hypothetical protein
VKQRDLATVTWLRARDGQAAGSQDTGRRAPVIDIRTGIDLEPDRRFVRQGCARLARRPAWTTSSSPSRWRG